MLSRDRNLGGGVGDKEDGVVGKLQGEEDGVVGKLVNDGGVE